MGLTEYGPGTAFAGVIGDLITDTEAEMRTAMARQ